MNLVRLHNPAVRYYSNPFTNDLFDQVWNPGRVAANCTPNPAANIFETEKDFRIELSVPGFSKEEIEILVEKNHLIVKSDYKGTDNQEYKFARVEFAKKSFEKRYKLSEKLNTEAISAEFKNGILTIALPKLDEESQKTMRKIAIS